MTSHKSPFALMLLLCVCTWRGFGQDDSTWSRSHDKWNWFRWHRSPTLTLSYGFVQSGLEGLAQSAFAPRSLELRMGGGRVDEMSQSAYVVEHRNEYFSIMAANKDLGGQVNPGEISFASWSLGFSWERGYGYKFSSAAEGPAIYLLPVHGVQWTNFAVKSGITNGPDNALLGDYEGGMRFGTKGGGLIRFHLLPLLAVDVGYDRMVIYRRLKFWEWLGSVIVEGGGDWAVDRFAERVLDSSPGAAPIVNFVLKSAVSYGMYELRKKNGNWPFESEAPVTYDTWRIGMTMVF
jgi:hypothetical protein